MMTRSRSKASSLGMVLVLVLSMSAFQCNSGGNATHNLAVASDAIASSLINAQAASKQAVVSGVISQADATQFQGYLVKVAEAGKILDQGIRANESASTLSGKVNSFMDAFNQLQSTGLTGIKNDNLKITLSTIITGAEASVAIIAATVGTGSAPAPAPVPAQGKAN